MSESNATQQATAPQPAPVAAGQPEAPQAAATAPQSPGSQTQSYDPNQVAQWKRQAEQYAGAKPLIDGLIQRGVKTPDDLQSKFGILSEYQELDSVLQQRGLDRSALRNLLSGPSGSQQPEQTGQSQTLTEQDVARVVDNTLEARELRSSHNAAVQAEKSAVEKAVGDIAGANSPAEYRQVVETLLRSRLDQEAGMYPDNHPLSQSAFQPLTADRVQAIAAEVKTTMDAIRGQQAVARAEAAMAAAGATGGGNLQTSGSAPETATPFYRKSDVEQLAAAKQAMDSAMQRVTNQPMSSV